MVDDVLFRAMSWAIPTRLIILLLTQQSLVYAFGSGV